MAKGRAAGARSVFRDQLQEKFGRLPRWAAKRLDAATSGQADIWTHKILRAECLEDVIGGE